ncbi:hypothetical protein [Corynebacterium timonense]|uniref:hypothetical protein n=1 Tax=Corynebacterium timonense TaxID=441500 RepID=UPI0012DBEF91|nr:hypothetical protein [Corynebacterium timonense]
MLKKVKAGVERRNIRGSIGGGVTGSGIPLRVRVSIIVMVNSRAPMSGASVDIWHCTAEGEYSRYSTG